MTDWKPTACILCSENCGLEVKLDGRRLASIRGDKAHPESQGYLCNKAGRLDHYQNHADRLSSPLRRLPDGSFEEVTWEDAIAEIAATLGGIRESHGGRAIGYYGGGGQGNHLPGVYASAFRAAIGTPWVYSALSQEKTGDFWVNGKLFGRQTCHVTADIEHAEVVLFLGTNPWQSHGFPRARTVLKALAADPERTMIVVDPRKTKTAKLADMHLPVRPGADAFLLSAMLGVIVQEELADQAFLTAHTSGWPAIQATFGSVDIDAFSARAGIDAEVTRSVARRLATASSACVRADLGIQQSLHSTLNSYLEKLLFLVTGNLGKEGTHGFHTFLVPLIGHSPEPGSEGAVVTPVTGMPAISKLFPPNVLPAEIDTDHPERMRALIVDSANPVRSGADSKAYRKAFARLDLLVCIDVALTETAQLADWVLPASSQFEKAEATFFNLSFPHNSFHLRAPLLTPEPGTLPEPEIYRRLTVAMGLLPERFPVLEAAVALHRAAPSLRALPLGIKAALATHPEWAPLLPLILYATLGKALPAEKRSAAVLWGAAQVYASKHTEAVKRAGITGNLGEALFSRILDGEHGVILSEHTWEDTWSFMRTADRRVALAIPRLLDEVRALPQEPSHIDAEFPFVLQAGERRMWNANTIFRDPTWRGTDPDGALHVHPDDASKLGIEQGATVTVQTRGGQADVVVAITDTVQPGVLGLPHGYGLDHPDASGERVRTGAGVNELTSAAWCDPWTRTPLHKHVPARLAVAPGGSEPARSAATGADHAV